ncbi:MAG: bifunctional ornithine acetyltransferase/N-acetylglutamate synthase [Acidobacteriales bacterium 13_2_20CM_55_8]|jgi:glutamate N-acetyltransferase/amino-acid N-acetyltransferase|nr:MAG: bifunctional ornithine acetyltransferase/N-acetylglutamate synthase [Acidobacteriales bacterium 13_2_20CM_55_8]
MTLPRRSPGKIYLPQGFSFSAACAGIKASGRLDLGLVEAAPRTTAAAVFTKNRVVAAPVEIGRAALAATKGRVRAVIVNSGNANCATGNHAYRSCQRICGATGQLLGLPSEEVFPSSTGIIGVPLPTEKILPTLATLVSERGTTRKHLDQFVRAIMTTDKRPKLASVRFRSGKETITVLGVAKGSGMIHPQLATMLVYLFADAVATPADLKRLLRGTCEQTFNCISVDGDTSTNDTVLLLASGQSGGRLNDGSRKQFADALGEVCQSLAEQIVSDGEGVQHVIRLSVEQASSREEALRVARAVAHSLLVKTAWAGADPNWGRILAAVGASGVAIKPDTVNIFIGSQLVCRNGASCPFAERKAHRHLAKPVSDVRIILQRGHANTKFLTTDLTADYVRINADYST